MARYRTSRGLSKRIRIFIFSDGKTEINYFDLKKKDLPRNRNLSVELIPTNIKSAVKSVNYIKRYFSRNDYGLNQNDRVFCVFDMDTADNEDLRRAITKMPGYMHLIISNPDFEFWFLLHYEYYQERLANREPIEKLRKHERAYEKPNVIEIYSSLKEKEAFAIQNAQRLSFYHTRIGHDLYSTAANPFTNVDEAISFINNHCQT
ncbi:RloB domain-containing protein [Methanofollis formosanus]|uniref:RloB domain-containing protein n=1 Tax=Methanofollis formosanus TaxID=299308 RepID=A0A8G1A338_9EURY|nr:RloB family protein [Methanofollis formosanus]QYZ80180.1 RloB domain-containing protein [Methanofollis formosanus]